jgi:hypothetical protein
MNACSLCLYLADANLLLEIIPTAELESKFPRIYLNYTLKNVRKKAVHLHEVYILYNVAERVNNLAVPCHRPLAPYPSSRKSVFDSGRLEVRFIVTNYPTTKFTRAVTHFLSLSL